MLTEADVEWLKYFYPKLSVNSDRSEIQGELSFTGTYDERSGQFLVLREGVKNTIGGIVIEGSYKIKIIKRKKDNLVSSKLPAFLLEAKQIPLTPDRHFNSADGSACTCGPIEEERYLFKGYQFKTFFDQFLIPFLYEQKYYDSHNKTWPWGEYGHGSVGILASYSRFGNSTDIMNILAKLKRDAHWNTTVKSLLSRNGYVKGHTVCWCGKMKAIRKCHPETWDGINKLKKDMEEDAIII